MGDLPYFFRPRISRASAGVAISRPSSLAKALTFSTSSPLDLAFLVNKIPAGSTWTVTGVGRGAWPMVATGIIMGGHVRVGFEDNIYLERGVKAKSNGELVEKVKAFAKLLGREVATPAEAREILGLKK